MAKKVEIRLADNPSNNDGFTHYPVVPSEFYSNINTFYFKTTPTSGYITIGATKLDSENNLFDFVTSFYSSYEWITVTKVTNGIDILFLPNDTTFTTVGGAITGDITLTVVTVTIDAFTRDNIISTRSPYNINLQPTALFDEAFLNLKVYRGTQTTDAPSTTTFPLSKSVIQAGQPKIRFEVSKLLNDYTKNNIYAFGDTGVHTSSLYDSVWIDAEIIAYYLGTEIGQANRQYLAVDGFGWHTELYNPKLQKNVLSSIDKHIFYLGSDYPVYFVSKGLENIYVNEAPVSFTLDETINNQIIAFLNVGAYASTTGNIQVIFDYGTTYEEHNFTVLSECRFPLYNCFFKNKFGFWQSIPFNLRSKETVEGESNEYMPVVSVYGEYSLLSHNTKTYQPSAKTTITCNTDYLPEYYNTLFKELILSEFVYLEHNGTYLPVNLNKKTIDLKTKKFDKLIQYTMDFKYSFNEMNTVI